MLPTSLDFFIRKIKLKLRIAIIIKKTRLHDNRQGHRRYRVVLSPQASNHPDNAVARLPKYYLDHRATSAAHPQVFRLTIERVGKQGYLVLEYRHREPGLGGHAIEC